MAERRKLDGRICKIGIQQEVRTDALRGTVEGEKSLNESQVVGNKSRLLRDGVIGLSDGRC